MIATGQDGRLPMEALLRNASTPTVDAADPRPSGQETRRLEALSRTGLLDSPPEEPFDRLTRLACRFLRTPIALVSLVDSGRQFLKSQQGLPEPWASRRETPLSWSFCRHVVADNTPLVVADAREHPLVHANPAVREIGIVAYLGVPLAAPDGQVLGSFCVIDRVPRRWDQDDVAVVRDLAGAAASEVALRLELLERRQAEAALARQAALQRAVLDALPAHVALLDPDGIVIATNAAWDRFAAENGHAAPTAWCGADYLGTCESARGAWTEGAAEAAAGLRGVLGGRSDRFSLEYPCHAPGERRWFLMTAAALAGRQGAVVMHVDITERKQAELALAASETEFRAVFETAGVGMAVSDTATGRFLRVNRRLGAFLGRDETELLGMSVGDVIHPSDRDEGLEALRAGTLAGRAHAVEIRYCRKDGTVVWGAVNGTPLPGGEDGSPRVLGIVQDITARKEAEAQRELLARELNHRVKNVLTLVLAIARQTADRAESIPDYVEILVGRLRALAAAQDMLVLAGWRGASLAGLAKATLAPHLDEGKERLRLEVEDLPIKASAAQNLALALHELATNATRHGAWTRPDGRVELRLGRRETGRGGAVVELRWRETGGPAVRAPRRTGFGILLLRRVIAVQHKGEVEIDWRPEGLCCRVALPAAEIVEPRDAG